jgi:hypothetical protein
MRALALLPVVALLLLPTGILAIEKPRTGSEIFARAGIIAVVEIDSVMRASASSVCDPTRFEVRVRLRESWKGGRPKAVLCSDRGWCAGCRVLVAAGGDAGNRDVIHGWPIEHLGGRWIVRPTHIDPLLLEGLQPVPMRMSLCNATSDRDCRDIVLYRYFPLERIRLLSQARKLP